MIGRGHIVDPETGCWIWQGSTWRGGYGQVRFKGRKMGAHRAYYEEAHGPIATGLQLDHLCRRPICVNPDHLEPVTNAENTRRGATADGTREHLDEIKALCAGGMSRAEVARRFGVAPGTVSRIVLGVRWRE